MLLSFQSSSLNIAVPARGASTPTKCSQRLERQLEVPLLVCDATGVAGLTRATKRVTNGLQTKIELTPPAHRTKPIDHEPVKRV